MATILIAGGTGLIGTRLSELLQIEGHSVLHLSRTKDLDAKFPAYEWDLHQQTIDQEAVDQADYIVNLAGAGIAADPRGGAVGGYCRHGKGKGAGSVPGDGCRVGGHGIDCRIQNGVALPLGRAEMIQPGSGYRAG